MPSGNYDFYVEDATGCVVSFPFIINDPPTLVVDLGDDQTIELGAAIELEAFANSNNVVYNWTPLFNIDCDTCSSILATPTETVLYQVAITDTLNQCQATDDILVEVKKERKVYLLNFDFFNRWTRYI